jgi:hypothetical protein
VERFSNRSWVVLSMPDGLAGLRDRVQQILALRRRKGMTRFELVELLDRHHVHRAEPTIFVRDDVFGLSCTSDRLHGAVGWLASRRLALRLVIGLDDSHRGEALGGIASSSASSMASTAVTTSSGSAADGFDARHCQMRQVRPRSHG